MLAPSPFSRYFLPKGFIFFAHLLIFLCYHKIPKSVMQRKAHRPTSILGQQESSVLNPFPHILPIKGTRSVPFAHPLFGMAILNLEIDVGRPLEGNLFYILFQPFG
jgi:hypothetical protein